MKPLAWIVVAASLTLTACGGDDISKNGGSSSSPRGGGTGQEQGGWSKAAAMDGKAPEAEPSTTIDASGNTLVTWITNGPTSGVGNEMWGARYVTGSGWQTLTRLDTGDGSHPMTGPGTIQPQLVGNASGQAVAFWTEWMPEPNADALWARPYSPGAAWGVVFEVAPNVTSSTFTAGIDNQGNAIVAWPQATDLLNSRIAWTRYAPNGTWSTTALIQMPTQTGPGAVTGDTANGRQTNSTQLAIWTATFDVTNGWVNVNQAVSNTSLFATIDMPSAGMEAKGYIALVWGQLDVTGGKIFTTTMSQRYVAGTGWQAALAVAPEITEPSGFIATPMLTVNANGIAAVMWAEGGAVLQASVADASGNWGPLHQLPEHLNSAAAQYPPVVFNTAGNVTGAWQDSGTTGSSNVIAASYRSGAWSTSTSFGQDPQDASWPALAVNASGAMALIWQSYIQKRWPRTAGQLLCPEHVMT